MRLPKRGMHSPALSRKRKPRCIPESASRCTAPLRRKRMKSPSLSAPLMPRRSAESSPDAGAPTLRSLSWTNSIPRDLHRSNRELHPKPQNPPTAEAKILRLPTPSVPFSSSILTETFPQTRSPRLRTAGQLGDAQLSFSAVSSERELSPVRRPPSGQVPPPEEAAPKRKTVKRPPPLVVVPSDAPTRSISKTKHSAVPTGLRSLTTVPLKSVTSSGGIPKNGAGAKEPPLRSARGVRESAAAALNERQSRLMRHLLQLTGSAGDVADEGIEEAIGERPKAAPPAPKARPRSRACEKSGPQLRDPYTRRSHGISSTAS